MQSVPLCGFRPVADNQGEVGGGDAGRVRGGAVEGAGVLGTDLGDDELGHELKQEEIYVYSMTRSSPSSSCSFPLLKISCSHRRSHYKF